jgi:hypothetical protein
MTKIPPRNEFSMEGLEAGGSIVAPVIFIRGSDEGALKQRTALLSS